MTEQQQVPDARLAVLVIGAAETADLAERELRAELDGDCTVVRVHDLDDPAWEATDLSGVALAVVDDAHPHEVITAIVQRTERHPRVLLITNQAMHDDLFHLYDADLLHGVVAAPWTPGRLAVQAQGQLARWSETSASPPTHEGGEPESQLLRSVQQPLTEVVHELVEAIEGVLGPRPRLVMPEGTRIIHEDSEIDGLLIVLRGQVALGVASPTGKIRLHHTSTGPLIGLPALLERQPAQATAQATTEVELIHLTVEQLDQALSRSARVGLLMTAVSMRSLARRLRRAALQQVEQARLNAELAEERARLSEALSDLSEARLALIAQSRSATIGDMAAGITHELNSPLAALTRAIDHAERDVLTMLATHPDAAALIEIITAARDRPLLSARDERRIRRELAAAGLPDRRVRLLVSAGVSTVEAAREVEQSGIADDQLEAAAGLGAALRNARLAEEHIVGLVKSLRSVMRPEHTEPVATSVQETIDDAVRLTAHRLDGIEVVRDYDDLEPVLAHPGQLTQVWANLLVNAADALAGSGTIEITLRSRGAKGVRVEVRDDGPGIPEELQERIFEPRFTTKAGAVRFGLGLGLGIARRIVAEHGGTISVRSHPGETVFTIDLPAQPPPPSEGGLS